MKSKIPTKVKKMKERTRDRKAYAMHRCRSFDFPPTRRPSLDPSSSTIFFFNGVFRVSEIIPCIILLNKARYTLLLKPKKSSIWKTAWKTTSRVRKRRIMCGGGTYSRVSRQHDRAPLTRSVVASGHCGSLASWMLHFELRLGSLDSPWIACSGPIGLVLLLSWLGWPQLLAFLVKLSPKYSNLQSKLKNTHNQSINRFCNP